MEAAKTNIIGTDNVLTAAIEAGVKSVICLSTDKAAYPINAMGTSKKMEEKITFFEKVYKTQAVYSWHKDVFESEGLEKVK